MNKENRIELFNEAAQCKEKLLNDLSRGKRIIINWKFLQIEKINTFLNTDLIEYLYQYEFKLIGADGDDILMVYFLTNDESHIYGRNYTGNLLLN